MRPRQLREPGSYFGHPIEDDPFVSIKDGPFVSTGRPRSCPVIAVVPSLTDAAQATILEVIGVHAPGKGLIGQSSSAVIMEAGSVISGHCNNHPFNFTITVPHGNLVVLASPFAQGSPILSMKQDIDIFVDTSQVRLLFEQNFRSFVFEVHANQSISLRGGTFYAIIALTDAGVSLTRSTVPVNILRWLFARWLLTMHPQCIVILQ